MVTGRPTCTASVRKTPYRTQLTHHLVRDGQVDEIREGGCRLQLSGVLQALRRALDVGTGDALVLRPRPRLDQLVVRRGDDLGILLRVLDGDVEDLLPLSR